MGFGFDVKSVTVSPRLDGAIATATDGGAHFLRIDDGALTEAPAGDIGANAQSIVFSPGGSAAALYSGNSVQVVTGLPSAPKLRSTISVGSQAARGAGGQPSSRPQPRRVAMAVTDDGEYLLFATGNSVRLLGANGDDQTILETGGAALVAFAAGSHDAAIADPHGVGAIVVKDAAGVPTRRSLASREAIATATGIAFSADGSHLLVASPGDRAVLSYSVDSGERTAVACECAPSGLTAMGRVFLLNELGKDPLWLFDAAAAEPRTVFVPALSAY